MNISAGDEEQEKQLALICTGKSEIDKQLGGGIPIGALLAKEHASVFVPGDHNSTFSGNPVVTAAAYAVLKYVLDNNIVGNVKKISKYLMEKLGVLREKYPFIIDVRGRGFLVAIEFNGDIAQDILLACLEKGLLVNKLKSNAIRLIPPLIIDEKDVDLAVSVLDDVFSGVD